MKKASLYGYAAAALFLLLLWQAAAWWAGPLIVPGPVPTFQVLGREVMTREYWVHFWLSAFRIVVSLAAAFVAAVPLGLALGGSRRLYRLTSPLIYLSYPIPKIVFLPLILLVFGLGNSSKIFLIALIVFFQLLITTRDAARRITTGMRYSMKSLGAGRWDFFVHVIWPFSLPGIFTSLRIGVGTAVAVLFFAESIGATHGLGLYIINSWSLADSGRMFAGIVSLSTLGVLIYEIFDLLEKHYCRWTRL